MPRASDEPVRLTRIYTRGGDGGETSLGDGSRVSKLDSRIAAYGTVDELNSQIGLVIARGCPDEIAVTLARVQNELFDVGADLRVPFAVEGRLRVTQEHGRRARARLRPLQRRRSRSCARSSCPAGPSPPRACTSRAPICRRAERAALAAAAEHEIDPLVPVYLNRLSDLLFILARAANALSGVGRAALEARRRARVAGAEWTPGACCSGSAGRSSPGTSAPCSGSCSARSGCR